MSDPEIVITRLSGWPPDSRLYRVDGRHWIVTVPSPDGVRRVLVRAAQAMRAAGIDAPSVEADTTPAPTVIFQADVVVTPVMEWVDDGDTPDGLPSEGSTFAVEHPDENHTVFLVNGQRWGGQHREPVGETYIVTPIDANGDPLDGLTPWAVLPAGTTFEQALDHITTTIEETT